MDLRKLAVNMIPFSTLHFLITFFSSLQSCQINLNEHILIKQMFDINNQMVEFNPRHEKYLTAIGIFRQ